MSVLRTSRREPPAPPSGTSYGSAPSASAAGASGDAALAGSAAGGPFRPGGPNEPDGPDGLDGPDGSAGEAAGPPAESRTPSGLPRREPASLRGAKRRPGAGSGSDGGAAQAPERSEEELSAARRAFADDLTSFSLGTQDTPETQDPGKGTPA